MTTAYYYLIEPFERVETSEEGDRQRVTVWIEGQAASWLLSLDAAQDLAVALSDRTDDVRCPIFWSSAGMRENVRGLDPNLTLVSGDTGKVWTVAQLRAKAAALTTKGGDDGK